MLRAVIKKTNYREGVEENKFKASKRQLYEVLQSQNLENHKQTSQQRKTIIL